MSLFAPPRPRIPLVITGEEAAIFLQGLITNDMTRLTPRALLYGALLTPQGKIVQTFFASVRDGGGYWLDIDAAGADDLMRRLRLFRLRAKVEIENADGSHGIALSLDEGDFADPRGAGLGSRRVLKKSTLPPAPPDYEQARINAMVPDQGADFGPEELFPADANMDWQAGVAFKKGCYVGQEVVSRMKRRGSIRKRMALARFDGPAPEYGTVIMAGPARLGEVRSSHGSSAVALVRTDRLATALANGVLVMADGRPLTLTLPEEKP